MSSDFNASTFDRVCGPPQTTTSKIACCSYRLPTVSPETSVLDLAPDVAGPEPVALRRRQVDLDRHRRLAHLRLDLGRDDALDRLAAPPATCSAVARSVGKSSPETRTTSSSPVEALDRGHPVVGVGLHLAAQPG